MFSIIQNLLFFKAVWALSLFGVVIDMAWLGCVGLAIFLVWHAINSETASADFRVATCAVLIGMTLDTLYLRSGLIAYSGQFPWPELAPLWIAALWANLALTLNGCLRWLQDRLELAALFGLICGPVSYAGAIALDVATVTGSPYLLYPAIGIAWAITLPTLLTIAKRFSENEVLVPAPF
jgi:hypothetical protein